MSQIVDVSLVIPVATNKAWDGLPLIERVVNQSVWPSEILLIEVTPVDQSTILKKCSSLVGSGVLIRFVPSLGAFPGAARNLGVALAKNSKVAFLDLNTLPRSNWLATSLDLLSVQSSDGVVGACVFVGESYFSWLLIDSLFGRNVVSTFPGSIFTRDGFLKVGPMLEKVRAGEDNEWFQRARLMNVNFYSGSGRANCEYVGFKDISYIQFVRKWNRNYLSAARLPQYKLIYEFNIVVWFLVLLGLALNWNSIFADWDMSSPLYFPHVTKIVLGLSLAGYLFLRTIYLPVRRGAQLANVLSYRLPFIFAVVLTADLIKARAFLSRFIFRGR